MDLKPKPITWEAELIVDDATDERKTEVAGVVQFPENKTPDLLFFHGIMVSTGTNLNDAHFLGSEIFAADNSFDSKTLDLEHNEDQIVGHIYSHKFVGRDGSILEKEDMAKMTKSELDALDFDVHIAGIIYKSRFSELADEIKKGQWKLSMETFYQNYDIKIGNVIMSKQEAEALGIAADSSFGKVARLLKGGTEIAKGKVARVLRSLMFSGCGVVKNPAEPKAIILETAKQKGLNVEELTVEIINEEIAGVEETTDTPPVAEETNKDVADLDAVS